MRRLLYHVFISVIFLLNVKCHSSRISPNALRISKGSVLQIVYSLNNKNTNLKFTASPLFLATEKTRVHFVSRDTYVASVSPSDCHLTSEDSQCVITVHGLHIGEAVIIAEINDQEVQRYNIQVGTEPVCGRMAVRTTTFDEQWPIDITSFTSNNQSISVQFSSYQKINSPSYATTGKQYYPLYIRGGLFESSGIGNNALFNVQTVTGVYLDPDLSSAPNAAQQCSVSTNNPSCLLTFYIDANAYESLKPLKLPVGIAGAITESCPYQSNDTVLLTPNTKKYPGTIEISTQGETQPAQNIPLNMNAPLFVNWRNVAINDTVTVTLNIASNDIQFYDYPAGNNQTPQYSSTKICVLEYPNATNCAFGIRGQSQGQAIISATATSSLSQYTIEPLILNVTAQEPAIRSVNFVNNSSKTIYLGITGGGANAYISPTRTVVLPNTPSADVKPGAGSSCGPSTQSGTGSPTAGCPIGTTCLQGGSQPVSTTPYYCYFDQPTPTCGAGCQNNYILTPNGATTLYISRSSGLGTNIIWSGNFYGRTNCDPQTGICENGDCHSTISGGLVCGPGTGGSPGTQTLAELTFQSKGSPDYYDVSIINGVNFAAAFGPNPDSQYSGKVNPYNAYICGTAGDPSPQAGGWTPVETPLYTCSPQNKTSNCGLPGASWNVAPNDSSFPTPPAISNSGISYYRSVQYSSGPAPAGNTCDKDSDCTPLTCGYVISTDYNSSFNIPTNAAINVTNPSYQKYCGTQIAWLTADEIFGFNSSGTSNTFKNLPFQFLNGSTNPVTGNLHSVGDQQLCIDNAYSSYNTRPKPYDKNGSLVLACGGVLWDQAQGQQITRVEHGVVTPQTYGTPPATDWITYVQPTLIWLKKSCPTCYSYPFDDESSTFTCTQAKDSKDTFAYRVTFSDLSGDLSL